MQTIVLSVFVLYTLILYRLPTIWDKTVPDTTAFEELLSHDLEPRNLTVVQSLGQPPPDDSKSPSRGVLATDAWFALALPATYDAVTIVATFNRSIIDHWHYFISVRMMAFAALVSLLVALSGSDSSYVTRYPLVSLLAACGIYLIIGRGLNAFHRPPPTTSGNTRFWTIREYTTALGRHPGPWRAAVFSTCVTAGLGTVLTGLIPRNWSPLIPVLTTGFEVSYLPLTQTFSQDSLTHCILGRIPAHQQIWQITTVHSLRRPHLPSRRVRALGVETSRGIAQVVHGSMGVRLAHDLQQGFSGPAHSHHFSKIPRVPMGAEKCSHVHHEPGASVCGPFASGGVEGARAHLDQAAGGRWVLLC